MLVGLLVDDVVKGGGRGRPGALDEGTWRKVVGLHVSQRTSPLRLVGGVLLVRVATSAWAQELALLKTTLCERLAAQGFPVRDVRFSVGPVTAPQRTLGVQVRVPYRPRVPLPDSLLAELEKLDDPELRMALSRAASSNYAWQGAVLNAAPTSARQAAQALRPAAAGSDRSDQTSRPAPGAAGYSRGGRRG